MKVCKKCGNEISDDASDFCDNCSQINAKKADVKIGKCEEVIDTISVIMLVFGIICSVVMFFTITHTKTYHYLDEEEVSWVGIAITILTFLSSILLYSLLQLAIGVSKNIRSMANKYN